MFRYVIIIIISATGWSFLFSQQPLQKKHSMAVLEFQAAENLSSGEINTLTNRFRAALVQTETFEVVERERMTEILREQDFTLSDACNSTQCAVEVGQLLGVEFMIAGNIGKIGNLFTVDVRMIEVSSGKIPMALTRNHEGKIEGLLAVLEEIAGTLASKTPKAGYRTRPLGNKLWYIIGGTAVLGGASYLILSGKKIGKESGIDLPWLPPSGD